MSNVVRKVDPFAARAEFETGNGKAGVYRLGRMEELGIAKIGELPYSIRLLLEAALRNCDGYEVTEADVKKVRAEAKAD